MIIVRYFRSTDGVERVKKLREDYLRESNLISFSQID